MTLGFFGAWRTIEFQDLMEFVKEANISISGYDVQRTGSTFKRFLEIEASNLGIDSTSYYSLENRYTKINRKLRNRKTLYDSVKLPTLALIKDYEKMNAILQDSSKGQSRGVELSKKTISNRTAYLNYYLEFLKDKDWNKRWKSRDYAMASNIIWLIDNLYKDRKVIIVGHNFHISKFNQNEEVMGEILHKKYKKEIYSLGVFAAKGSYFGNSGKKEQLAKPHPSLLDIKHIIASLDGAINYISIPENPTKNNSWLFNKIIVEDTFIDLSGSNSMILSKHFDALLLLDEVSPPDMIEWNE